MPTSNHQQKSYVPGRSVGTRAVLWLWLGCIALLLGHGVPLSAVDQPVAEGETPATAPANEPSTASAMAPAGEAPNVPTVLTPTVETGLAIGTVAPLPNLRPEPTSSDTAPAEIPATKPQLLPNGELPKDFDTLPLEDQMRLLVDQRVQAAAILLKDAHTGEILFARDEEGLYPPASTTKLLTALLCYEMAGLDSVITVTEEDTKVEPSHVPLLAGEKVMSRELIYSLLIGSDNDSAMALGRSAAGSMPEFLEMMNKYAIALGCRHSNFKNPNGLPAEGQVTTAADLMKIFQRVLERPDLRNICVVQQFPLTTAKGTQVVKNHNKLLGRYIGMGPAKTGWTRASQHTYAASATRGNRTFLLTLLKSPNKWFDARLLFDYAFSIRPADPKSLAPGVPAIPLVVQNRNLLTLPGGEVAKGKLPPEGLVVITDSLPGAIGGLEKKTLKNREDLAAAPKVSEGDADPAGQRFQARDTATVVPRSSTARITPGSRPGILQSSDGTTYLAESEGEADPKLAAPSGFKIRDYTIRSGDTLAIIAARHGCTVAMIEQYNKIPNRHRIVPGQHLKVPQRQE